MLINGLSDGNSKQNTLTIRIIDKDLTKYFLLKFNNIANKM